MARISYDEQTAAAFKAVREAPRDGLGEWREAVRRHLRPSPGMTLADIGAGTGAFAAAFPVPLCSSARHSPAGPTGSSSSAGAPRPRGRSTPTPLSSRSARRSPPPDSARTPLSKFPRHTWPAASTSSARRTPCARPTQPCATPPRKSSSVAKSGSAAPSGTPGKQRAWRPEPHGLTSWSCADRSPSRAGIADKAALPAPASEPLPGRPGAADWPDAGPVRGEMIGT